MSINQTLWNAIDRGMFNAYNLPKDEIKKFLIHPESFLKRQMAAASIIKNIMSEHEKEMLKDSISELARIEHGTTKIKNMGRDHVVHAVLSFLLGIYINEHLCLQYRVDEFQWKLAGLFHDIGYPVQLSIKILTDYLKKVEKIGSKTEVRTQYPMLDLKISGFEGLQNPIKSFELINEKLKKWKLEHLNAEKIYSDCFASTDAGIYIDHGVISGLSILFLIDLLYQKNNPDRTNDTSKLGGYYKWKQEYFEEDVVSACSAIFIHNLPKKYFVNNKVDINNAPLAYLLILSDSLQDWNRPGYAANGNPARQYDIDFDKNMLIYKAPKNKIDKIREELQEKLANIDHLVIFESM